MLSRSQQPKQSERNTMVVAHRGASAYAPENTVASAKLGWILGADAVEVDVRLSSDQHIVVIHDQNTERTSGKKWVVSDEPLSNLQTLDVGSWKDEKYRGEPIPTLFEVVSLIPEGKKLFVELKGDDSLVPILQREFNHDPKLDQLNFIAFDYETITAVKESFPDNKAYWLSSEPFACTRSMLEKVKHDGLDGVDLHYSLITPALMSTANELRLEMHCWTVNNQEKAVTLSALGVYSMTTDVPDQIMNRLIAG